MLKFKTEDYKFFFPMLDEDQQKALKACSTQTETEVIVDDADTEVDLYNWLDDLVISQGLTADQEAPNDIGIRLEPLIDYVFSVIEE